MKPVTDLKAEEARLPTPIAPCPFLEVVHVGVHGKRYFCHHWTGRREAYDEACLLRDMADCPIIVAVRGECPGQPNPELLEPGVRQVIAEVLPLKDEGMEP